MTKVRVKLYATVRDALGKSEMELEAETLGHLLRELELAVNERTGRSPPSATDSVSSWVVLVNGRNVLPSEMTGMPLRDGDEISVFPPVSGG